MFKKSIDTAQSEEENKNVHQRNSRYKDNGKKWEEVGEKHQNGTQNDRYEGKKNQNEEKKMRNHVC